MACRGSVPSVLRAEATARHSDLCHCTCVVCALRVCCRCSWGQELCLVGSGEALGNWSVENGKRMHWTDGDVWQVEFEVSAG